MADGCDHFLLFGCLTDQLHHRRMPAHMIGRIASGNDDRIKLRDPHLIGFRIRLHRIAVLRAIALSPSADDRDVSSGLTQTEHRVPQLEILVIVLCEDGHTLSLEFHRRPPSSLAHTAISLPSAARVTPLAWARACDRRSKIPRQTLIDPLLSHLKGLPIGVLSHWKCSLTW